MFKTIVVEDNIRFRQSLKEFLCNRFPSMAVEEAGDGEEALRKLKFYILKSFYYNRKLQRCRVTV